MAVRHTWPHMNTTQNPRGTHRISSFDTVRPDTAIWHSRLTEWLQRLCRTTEPALEVDQTAADIPAWLCRLGPPAYQSMAVTTQTQLSRAIGNTVFNASHWLLSVTKYAQLKHIPKTDNLMTDILKIRLLTIASIASKPLCNIVPLFSADNDRHYCVLCSYENCYYWQTGLILTTVLNLTVLLDI